ncbi:MAG: MFS transporter [Bryobacterales bacterium]|nr:MFS transporter [Bryobacterales bacterium]MBV9398203.1 MFS transporter [Bryobacterales bacterium]
MIARRVGNPPQVGNLPHTRWIAVAVFVLSTSLNYLDRQLLAAVAPTLRSEFHLSYAQYGQIQSVFNLSYSIIAPFAGWFIDFVGLNLGATIAVAVWSLAGAVTALLRSFSGLLACRTILGAAEAASIPSTGKANATYLESHELALGTAINNVGLSLGSIAAPLLVASLAPRFGWRSVFAACGIGGLLWIPLWWVTSRRVPARAVKKQERTTTMTELLRDGRLWGLAIGNAFVMTVFLLWTNWTTVYFVQARHMAQDQANRQFVWIPTVLGIAGGFVGGAAAYYLIKRGSPAVKARLRVCWIGACVLLLTAAVPFMPSDGLATAAISLSFFSTLTLSTNIYALPIDLFGARHAAFGVAALTCSYGLMAAALSPAIGLAVDLVGFTPVCAGLSVLPLVGVMLLQRYVGPRQNSPRPRMQSHARA